MLEIRLSPRRFHFRTPAATSRGALPHRDLLLVEALDGERLGLGESGPIPGLSADDGPDWVAAAERAVAAFNSMRHQVPPGGTAAVAGVQALLDTLPSLERLPSLRFGLECALLDLAGGGTGLLFPSAFTLGERSLPTHGLLWMDSADGMLAQADRKVAAGFDLLKLKIGALPLDEEVRLLDLLHDRYPHIRFRLDANGAFTQAEALNVLARLTHLPIEFVEQPVAPGNYLSLCEVIRKSSLPVALDEELILLAQSERLALLETLAAVSGRPPVLVLKPALLGGFGPTAELANRCDALALPWIVNSLLEVAPGHSAICQWTASRLERSSVPERVHGLGTGSLFADDLPSPITLRGNALHWMPAR